MIPIYNVEGYLRECLESVVSQTYRNLDIILVDDGSTDCSGRIADEFACGDSRITVVHKDNKGLSDARNAGTRKASGNFLFYLDSDDYVCPSTIEQLIDFALVENCDVVQGGFYYLYADHMLFDKRYGATNGPCSVLSKHEAMTALAKNVKIKNFAWGKLYRKSLVDKYDFPVGKYFEDSFWQYKVISECERYGIINQPLTYYRQRAGSISGNGISTKLLDLIDGNIERAEHIRIYYPDIFPVAIRSLWDALYDICYRSGRKHKAFRVKLDYVMEKYADEFQALLSNLVEFKLVKGHHSKLLTLHNLTKRILSRLSPNEMVSFPIK